MFRNAALFSLLAVALLLPGIARAEDDAEESASPLRMALFDLSFLTQGRTNQIRAFPPRLDLQAPTDESRPLFGAEAEEPILPLGTIDELIEIIKNGVEPQYWEEREGADIRSSGWHGLVVRADPRILDAVARFVRELEMGLGQMVTVDIRAVRLERSEVLALRRAGFDDAHVEALLRGPRAGPSQSVTAFAGQRVAAFGGRQWAWIRRIHTTVASDSELAYPWVGVANLGLAVGVVAVPVPGDDDVVVGLDASVSDLAEVRNVDAGKAGMLEAPTFAVSTHRAAVVVRAGAWTLVDGVGAEDGEGGWYLLLRATPWELPVSRSRWTGLDVSLFPDLPAEDLKFDDLVLRHHPVFALTAAPENVRGQGTHLMPSRFTPPEPPELPEPVPVLSGEGLVDLIREAAGEAAWEDPASIEARSRVLIARHTPAMQEAIARCLDALRDRLLRSVRVTAELLETEAGVADALGTGGPLDEPALRHLQAAIQAGVARHADIAHVISTAGARNTTVAGRYVAYVGDYEPQIAESAAISYPAVSQFLHGVEVDVEPTPTLDGQTFHLAVRYARARPSGPMRRWSTTGGATVELPELGIERVRTDLAVALDQPTVVATWGHGDRRHVLIVRVERR